MAEESVLDIVSTLREKGVQYIVGAQGQPLAVLLSLEEYEHYLDLLDDEADSQDEDLTARFREAASRGDRERQSFRSYLNERTGAEVPD